MANSMVSVSSNWIHIGGCAFPKSVQERPADPDCFIKPLLKELVNEEKSILLSKDLSSEYCELYVKILSHYKIQAISFVCNVVKVEIFQGPIREYLQTIYGVVVEEDEDQFISYRYDVEIEKSGITDLTLRFLTDSSDICIFGLILHTSPNPNGITTLLQNSVIKSDTVPDKCKELFELVAKRNQCPEETDECCATTDKVAMNMVHCLKSHIDNRFKETEIRIIRYLEDMEQRQNQKLDEILNILERKIHK